MNVTRNLTTNQGRLVRLPVAVGAMLMAVLLVAAGPGQETSCPQGGEPTGCVEITLVPNTLVGDFFIGDQQAASGVNPGHIQVPPRTTTRIDVRNLRDSSEGFGDAYTYAETYTNVWVSEGQTGRYTLYPSKVFTKGFLELTCDIRSVREGDNVACRPFIDGQGHPNVPPGEKETYNLETGSHSLRVEVVGNNANLWGPTIEQSAFISGGSTRYQRVTFNKLGSLTIVFDQEGLVGDFYVDGELVAQRAATAQQWVAAYQSHRVEARNITDPDSGGTTVWRDASGRAYLSPGQESTTTLRPRAETVTPSSSPDDSSQDDSSQDNSWKNMPIVPVVSGTARGIYQRGLAKGNDPHSFSVVGDCQNVTSHFLADFDRPGSYSLGEYGYLQATIDYFSGSFSADRAAVRGMYNVASVLSTSATNLALCKYGETPLECEFRRNNPSIVIISMETNFDQKSGDVYRTYMSQIVEYCIEEGVVPILATKADNLEGDHSINRAIVQVAQEYNVPLWNFWRAVQPLPNQGLTDGFHLSYARPFFDDPSRMEYGWPVRNLTALQALDAVRRGVSGG